MKRRINKLKFQINRLRLKRKVILLFLFILILAIYGINKMVSPISASPVHDETVSSANCKGTNVSQIICSLNGGTNKLYLLTAGIRDNQNIITVIGAGLNWLRAKSQCSANGANRTEVWYAFGSPSSGDVTITFDATVLSAVGAISRYSNADPTNPIENPAGSNRVGQESATCSGGSNSATATLDLTSTVGNTILFAGLDTGNQPLQTGDADYSLRFTGTVGSSNITTIYVHDRDWPTAGTDTITHSLSGSTGWSMAGLVIRPAPLPTVTPTATPVPISTLTPTITPTPLPATPTPTPFIGDNIDPINSIYSYSGLGYYSLDPTFDGNRTPQKDVTIMLVSGSLEIKQNFSLSDPQDSVVFIVNGNIYIGGDVTRIPGLFISSQTFTIADGDQPIIIDGMVYARTINFNRKFYSLTQPTYQFIYQPKYIIDLLPYLGRPQVNWQEISR